MTGLIIAVIVLAVLLIATLILYNVDTRAGKRTELKLREDIEFYKKSLVKVTDEKVRAVLSADHIKKIDALRMKLADIKVKRENKHITAEEAHFQADDALAQHAEDSFVIQMYHSLEKRY